LEVHHTRKDAGRGDNGEETFEDEAVDLKFVRKSWNEVKILTICSIFHVLGYRENIAFTMATLVVSVTLVPMVLLSIDIGLDIEQADWVPSF
jgi:hypothetical protein